jgi:antitoxin VapB
MALTIRRPEVVELARAICAITGESLTTAVEMAVRERLDRLRVDDTARLTRSIERLQAEFARCPSCQPCRVIPDTTATSRSISSTVL